MSHRPSDLILRGAQLRAPSNWTVTQRLDTEFYFYSLSTTFRPFYNLIDDHSSTCLWEIIRNKSQHFNLDVQMRDKKKNILLLTDISNSLLTFLWWHFLAFFTRQDVDYIWFKRASLRMIVNYLWIRCIMFSVILHPPRPFTDYDILMSTPNGQKIILSFHVFSRLFETNFHRFYLRPWRVWKCAISTKSLSDQAQDRHLTPATTPAGKCCCWKCHQKDSIPRVCFLFKSWI